MSKNPFPSPREVDRQLYDQGQQSTEQLPESFRPLARQIVVYTRKLSKFTARRKCFRPLSRQIGSYTHQVFHYDADLEEGFRPLARQIGGYTPIFNTLNQIYSEFPSPLEVDRYLYKESAFYSLKSGMFPSPLEVDRYLYPISCM